MRCTTEFTVKGRNIDEIHQAASRRWQVFTGRSDAELPFDAEFRVYPETEETAGSELNPVTTLWGADVLVRERSQ